MTNAHLGVERRVEHPKRRETPYFGLDYFREDDGAWFFGRETESARVITNLQAARLTLLHAESGVGKSSLLRAGVAWRLRKAGSAVDIPVVFAAWSDDPVDALIEAIGDAIEPFVPGPPKHGPSGARLDEAILEATRYAHASLVVLLDQFEEYFLYRSTEKPVPDHFADELARCISRTDLSANFLVAIREDAYARLGDLFKGRIANLYGNYLSIAYLDRCAAENAIRRPLEVYNTQPDVEIVGIEDNLVNTVLDQIQVPHTGRGQTLGVSPAGDEGSDAISTGGGDRRVATPLLQLVMQTIWEREREKGSHVLRLATLTELEGVEQIVDSHLSRALDKLGDSQRETAIDLLDRLVDPSGGKIAASVAELALRTDHSEAEAASVLQKLDQDRIVRPVQAPAGGDPVGLRRYEIFHDVLAPAITQTTAVRAEARKVRAEKVRAEAEKVRAEARKARNTRRLAIVLLVVALAVAGGFIYLWRTAVNANDQVNKANHLLNVTNQQLKAALTGAKEAPATDRTVIFSKLDNPDAIAITTDGGTAYVSNEGNGTVIPIDLKTGKAGTAISVGASARPMGIAITPNGAAAYVANYGSNNVIPIDLKTGKAGNAIPVGAQPIAVAIAPDGNTAYVANQGSGTVTPIQLKTGKPGQPIEVGQLPVAIAITRNGATAYVARQYDSVTPVNLQTRTPGTEIPVIGRPVAIAITPDSSAAYVADYANGAVTPIRLGGDSWIDELGGLAVWEAPTKFPPLLPPPMPIGIAPNGTTAYVANFYKGTLVRISLPVGGPG